MMFIIIIINRLILSFAQLLVFIIRFFLLIIGGYGLQNAALEMMIALLIPLKQAPVSLGNNIQNFNKFMSKHAHRPYIVQQNHKCRDLSVLWQ